ncbi:hypothetical protein PHYBLDRAFT_8604, partial [Phycomyces blakesleeanus NRRL 1555(-)]
GVRQGNLLSPVLFNFVLEPLLLHILDYSLFQGYTIPQSVPSTSLKVLAYTDNFLAFL